MSGGPGAEVWLVVSTAPDAETAARLGRRAVEGRQAACANVLPGVRSIYRWKGAVEDTPEILILFKTTAAAYPGLARLIAAEHPYEVPELLAFPAATGLPPYLDWVRAETAAVDTLGARA